MFGIPIVYVFSCQTQPCRIIIALVENMGEMFIRESYAVRENKRRDGFPFFKIKDDDNGLSMV